VKVLTTARHVSNDAGSPEASASAECAVGAEGMGAGDVAIRLSLCPKPFNMSPGSRRGANSAAPPINNPGMSAASTIAAPATMAPRVATPPIKPEPEAEPGYQPLAFVKDVVKREFSINVVRHRARRSG
jgi:hypothetical protein